VTTRALIPVEVYLTSVYRPDCDYLNGEVLERNSGGREHSYVLAALGSYFFARRNCWDIEVYPGQRIQLSSTRFRVPDLCVVLGGTKEDVFTFRPSYVSRSCLPRTR
jgi:hypothetical protein